MAPCPCKSSTHTRCTAQYSNSPFLAKNDKERSFLSFLQYTSSEWGNFFLNRDWCFLPEIGQNGERQPTSDGFCRRLLTTQITIRAQSSLAFSTFRFSPLHLLAHHHLYLPGTRTRRRSRRSHSRCSPLAASCASARIHHGLQRRS